MRSTAWRSRRAFASCVMALVLCTAAPRSEPVRVSYTPELSDSEVHSPLLRIRSGLASTSNTERFDAFELLRDLSKAAARYDPYTAHPLTETQLWLGRALPQPDGFAGWATGVRQLLREEIGSDLVVILDDPAHRWTTLRIAGAIRWESPTFYELALAGLDSTDAVQRAAAASYLGLVGPRGIELTLNALSEADSTQRRNRFAVFAAAATFEDLPPILSATLSDTLARALVDCDPRIRDTASYALCWPGLAADRLLPAILAGTTSSDAVLARHCSEALLCPQYHRAGHRETILDLLDGESAESSRFALLWLVQEPDSDERLVAALDNRHAGTRSAALRVLCERRPDDPRLPKLIRKQLADLSTQDAAAKVCLLLDRRAVGLADALELSAARATNMPSRLVALHALAAVAVDSSHVAEVLLAHYEAATDSAYGSAERQSILQALPRLGVAAANFLPELEAILADPENGAYRDALDVIAAIGPAACRAAPLVVQFLATDRPYWIQAEAAAALVALACYPCSARGEIERLLMIGHLEPELRGRLVNLVDGIGCD